MALPLSEVRVSTFNLLKIYYMLETGSAWIEEINPEPLRNLVEQGRQMWSTIA